jgi:hypothetical protein
MSLSQLSTVEKLIVGECLAVIAKGKVIAHDGEFHTIFGLDVNQFLDVYQAWPDVDDAEEAVALAINNAMNNLLGYPHGYHEQWSIMMVASQRDVARVFKKWRRPNPPVKVKADANDQRRKQK